MRVYLESAKLKGTNGAELPEKGLIIVLLVDKDTGKVYEIIPYFVILELRGI